MYNSIPNENIPQKLRENKYVQAEKEKHSDNFPTVMT